jgi:prophage tail gpP-like protein
MADANTLWTAEPSIMLKFDGLRFDAWQEVDFGLSVDDLCAKGKLGIGGLDPAAKAIPLTANTVMEVFADDELVTTVRSDQRRRGVSATSSSRQLECRSLGRELVDCQYSAKMSGKKLGDIVKAICDIFKVPVKIDCKTEVVAEFAMQCEVPANALLNAARAANKLLYALPSGGLMLAEPNNEPAVATLTYGPQIKSYEVIEEDRLRFSDYVVKSFDYLSDTPLKGAAKDDGIKFFRPMHLVADKHGHTTGGCGRRAELERNRRKARAHRIELTVQGWHHAGGLYRINTQIRVVIPDDGIDDVLLVGDIHYKFNQKDGRTCTLAVMSREAFVGEPKTNKKRASNAQPKGLK